MRLLEGRRRATARRRGGRSDDAVGKRGERPGVGHPVRVREATVGTTTRRPLLRRPRTRVPPRPRAARPRDETLRRRPATDEARRLRQHEQLANVRGRDHVGTLK